MALIPIVFAELHNTLFLNKMNLHNKLDTTSKRTLQLFYDRQNRELVVINSGAVAIIPAEAVASMTPKDPADFGVILPPGALTVAPIHPTPVIKKSVKAQVQDPSRDVQNPRG